ncbi:MAG: amidohydrolase [Bacteroidia bacterium]
MKKIWFFAISILFILASCQENKKPKSLERAELKRADLIIKNATIYTVDSGFTTAEAMAVKNGEIVFIGSTVELEKQFISEQVSDLDGAYVYPGFADPHCHFLGYARTLLNVDLVGTTSQADVVKKASDFFGENPEGWIQGRGWDQNDWAESGWDVSRFPTKEVLDAAFPNNPVAFRRVDGHAVWVNSKALEMADIFEAQEIDGGEIVTDQNGKPTGILIDNAVGLVLNIIPENVKERDAEAIQRAQQNCFAVGLTFLHDAGLPLDDVLFLKEHYEQEKLRMRIYQMISHEEETVNYFETNGPILSDRFWVRSIKCYMDGALGSRGAWLKQPYHDAGGQSGLQVTQNEAMRTLLQKALKMKFQVNTHAIGDMAVRNTLNLYAEVLDAKSNLKWRIEHSQVVEKEDLALYNKYSIIPSIQATHATSDMYWADERLGDRIETAYTYQELLKTNGWIMNGSDFPVENINPLFGFYAAVARMDQKGFPEGGFQMENALTREQALKAMTIWAAKGAYLENDLGSLETGKKADFVILEKDLMTAPVEELYKLKVLETYINGESVYKSE